MKSLYIFSLFAWITWMSTACYAQGTEIPLNTDTYHYIDRMDILTHKNTGIHTAFKSYFRKAAVNYAIQVQDSTTFGLDKLNVQNLQYIYNDNNEWLSVSEDQITEATIERRDLVKKYIDSTHTFYALVERPLTTAQKKEKFREETRYMHSKKPILNTFYKTPANFIELNKEKFSLRLNPIIGFNFGKEFGADGARFINTRGLEFRAGIANKVWLYTNFYDTQARFSEYATHTIQKFGAIPGAGFFKTYNSSILKYTDDYDYLTAQGYITASVADAVDFKFGHGRQFIGDGYRSLILSDNAPDYFYLRVNWRFWRFNYQNLFAELTGQYVNGAIDRVLPKKWLAYHHLSYNILDNLSVGIFESVIFDRGNTFELQYLNPIILYRAVEQQLGSQDNVILGTNFKYNFLKHASVYGQVVFDEFLFKELFGGNGWYGNKYALQLGAKYYDMFGISHLDGQIEYNTARPYTYSHYDTTSVSYSKATYSHFNQSLAHPLGANFKEFVARVRYQPLQPLTFNAKLIASSFGTDTTGTNWGGNILQSYSHPTIPPGGTDPYFGHTTGQGIANKVLHFQLLTSYQLRHNLYIDLDAWLRRQKVADQLNSSAYLGVGVRLNIAPKVVDY
jgi:hypothetical protein